MADEKPTSWWATLPGLLTAAAAVITAVTGLLLGLGQLGVFDGGLPPHGKRLPRGRHFTARRPAPTKRNRDRCR